MKLLEEMRKAEQRSGALGKELAASKGELQRLKAGGQDVVRRYEARRTQWGSLGCGRRRADGGSSWRSAAWTWRRRRIEVYKVDIQKSCAYMMKQYSIVYMYNV